MSPSPLKETGSDSNLTGAKAFVFLGFHIMLSLQCLWVCLLPTSDASSHRITSLHNWQSWINKATTPFLVNVYDPHCEFCNLRGPSYDQVVSFVSENDFYRVTLPGAPSLPPITLQTTTLNCRKNEDVCNALDIKRIPALLMVNCKGSHAVDFYVGMKTAEEMLVRIKNNLQISYGLPVWTKEVDFERYPYLPRGMNATDLMGSSPSTRLQDAATAFLFLLHKQVFFLKENTVLKGEELDVLRNFIFAVYW